MVMSISEQMSLADVKNRLSEVVERLEREHGRIVITKHGRPAAVVLSIEDLESLEETLEILGNASLVHEISGSVAEFDNGGGRSLTKEEALALIPDR
jgi:prevent-host-death family protein